MRITALLKKLAILVVSCGSSFYIAHFQLLVNNTIGHSRTFEVCTIPHVITGLIYIEGAQPGDVLEVRTLAINYRSPYGVISNRHGRGALPSEYPIKNVPLYSKVIAIDARREVGVFQPENNLPALQIPLRPFIGLMGVVSANSEEAANSIPPGNYGGNVDIQLLGRGSSLYLPVQVRGSVMRVGGR